MTSLLCIVNFIKNRSAKHNLINDVTQLKDFSQTANNLFLLSIKQDRTLLRLMIIKCSDKIYHPNLL